LGHAQRYPPNPNAGAVIRVRLAGHDFRVVAQAARVAGMTLPTYMREAAVARAVAGQDPSAVAGAQWPEDEAAGTSR
jgi:hypothetical protein